MTYQQARARLQREIGKLAAGADAGGVIARVFD
jgi:hypothetical protein